ncbi:MAG: hypothetical protein Q9217_005482 [Psora testacea]
MPAFLTDNGHVRDNSDVQGKVAQFNNLAKDAAQRRRDNEAALKRAILGREEAEGESRRLREENSVLRKEVEEGRGRERRVGERVESLQEDLQRAKETHVHSQSIYEKEIRRARKEAFKSSSALVKLQEELKSARNRYTLMREEMETQRRNKADKEQEAFQAQYQLVGLQEEVEMLRKKLQVTEEERDALKFAVTVEDVEDAAEGAFAFPPSDEGGDIVSPKKRRIDEREHQKENVDPGAMETAWEDEELMTLEEELSFEKRLRRRAEEEVHFLKMECQLGICSCRVAESSGMQYIHDDTFATKVEKGQQAQNQRQEEKQENKQTEKANNDEGSDETTPADPALSSPVQQRQEVAERPIEQECIIFSPTSGTFLKTTSPTLPTPANELEPDSNPQATTPPPPAPQSEPQQFPIPTTPRPLSNLPYHAPRTISTTTTVPLKADDAVFGPAPNTPGGITREQALEQIRLRRGRARSFALGAGGDRDTAKDGESGRREISAPAGSGV